MRRVIALAHTLAQHLQPRSDGSFESRIIDLLGSKELERLQKSQHKPIHSSESHPDSLWAHSHLCDQHDEKSKHLASRSHGHHKSRPEV